MIARAGGASAQLRSASEEVDGFGDDLDAIAGDAIVVPTRIVERAQIEKTAPNSRGAAALPSATKQVTLWDSVFFAV